MVVELRGALEEMGHSWLGMDISRSMLDVAQSRDEAPEGDMILNDMGQGFKFRPGSFDGCISISAIQWLCNVDKTGHKPYNRLRAFFQALFNCLAKGARAVLQFYPETPQQLEMITSAAMRSGFGGGVVVDFPHSAKAKKHFLVIYAGFFSVPQTLPKAIQDENDEMQRNTIKMGGKEKGAVRTRKGKKQAKDRDWIMKKKDRQRQQGKKVRMDSKFTGRQRKPIF